MAFKDLPSTCINITTGLTTSYEIKYQSDNINSISKSEKQIDFKSIYIISVSFIGSSYPIIFHFSNKNDRDSWYSDLIS